mmetsp:Transcript_11042/g.24101  ORF Transcript_11042/g.24101 Transcript_11042/m.24101 type:complete len:210 (-) Transcript_11042:70-699(-)
MGFHPLDGPVVVPERGYQDTMLGVHWWVRMRPLLLPDVVPGGLLRVWADHFFDGGRGRDPPGHGRQGSGLVYVPLPTLDTVRVSAWCCAFQLLGLCLHAVGKGQGGIRLQDQNGNRSGRLSLLLSTVAAAHLCQRDEDECRKSIGAITCPLNMRPRIAQGAQSNFSFSGRVHSSLSTTFTRETYPHLGCLLGHGRTRIRGPWAVFVTTA